MLTKSLLDICKFKYIFFVRSSTIHEHKEPEIQIEKYFDQMNNGRHFGLGYVHPERKAFLRARLSRGSVLVEHTSMKDRHYRF